MAAVVAIAVLLAGYFAYQYVYQAHDTVDDLELTYSGSAQNFTSVVQQSDSPFLNSAVLIQGTITSITDQDLMLGSNIFCQLSPMTDLSTKNRIGDQITVKGRYIGYDELLEEIKLDQVEIE